MGARDQQPSEPNILILSDEDLYHWICSCGHDDWEDSYRDARAAVRHHREYHRMSDFRCAGMTGKHWRSLVGDMLWELAGGNGLRHLPDSKVDQLRKQARAMLASIEPGVDQMCDECRAWERKVDLVEIGGQ